jgi:hypothetical protein
VPVPAFVSLNGVLAITGTAGRDTTTVTAIPPAPDDAPPSFEVVLKGSAETAVVPSGQILFCGYAGNDSFTNKSTLLAVAVGGNGNDYLDDGAVARGAGRAFRRVASPAVADDRSLLAGCVTVNSSRPRCRTLAPLAW